MPDISYYRDIGHAAMAADICAIARAERNEGMAQALQHAERVQPAWGEIAYDALVDYATENSRFTSYDFRMAYHAAKRPPPPTDKAFGAVFQRAVRAGVIVKDGYDQHPERHASPTPVWRSKVVA